MFDDECWIVAVERVGGLLLDLVSLVERRVGAIIIIIIMFLVEVRGNGSRWRWR